MAYDEKFHEGVNFIRGENSSGKSTILDFIFFVLGGDVSVWKAAAAQCSDVTGEFSLTGTIVTLQREISPNRPPLSVFLGSMEDSDKTQFKNWSVYPYAARAGAESFSRVLFRLLKFPEVHSDKDNLITMHQILRLAYVDQVSRKTALLREHDFDTPLTRRIVADLLFGVYDDSLYAEEQELRKVKSEYETAEQQLIHNRDIVWAVEKDLDEKKLAEKITESQQRLSEVNDKIDIALAGTVTIKDTSQGETERLRVLITELNGTLHRVDTELEELRVDNKDSTDFMQSLHEKVRAIDESIAARDAFSNLPNCPICNVSLKHEDGVTHCEFSGKTVQSDYGKPELLKLRDEITFQVKESEQLAKERLNRVIALENERDRLNDLILNNTRTLKQKANNVRAARDNRLDTLYVEKGRLESTLEGILKMRKYLELLTRLEEVVRNLRARKGELEEGISQKRAKQRTRWSEVTKLVAGCVDFFLTNDLQRESAFTPYTSLDLLFQNNTYLWNGRNNFSASSTVMVKNSIHFGILFASTYDAQFRFPRFLLCDTIEEGGMEVKRSYHYQKILNEVGSKADQPFQAIIAVASLNPELEGKVTTVGPAYEYGAKALKLSPEAQQRATMPLISTIE